MRDDDLKNFFDADAYDELLNTYAEEAERKRSILADVHRKTDAPHKADTSHKAEMPRRTETPRKSAAPEKPIAPSPKHTPRSASQNRVKPAVPAEERHSAPAAPQAKQPQTPPHTSAVHSAHTVDSAPIVPLSPAVPPKGETPNRAANFKVEIKDLDAEFEQPARSAAPSRGKASFYTAQPQEKNRKQPNDGAFAAFSEIVKKRRAPQETSEAAFAPAEPAETVPQADIIKRRPQKLDWNTIKALFIKNKVTWIIIGICLVTAILLSTYTISCLNDVFAVHRDSETVVTVNIPAETNTRSVLKILQQNNLIEHRHFCSVFLKITHPRDYDYLTGVYYVTASMGVEKMLSTFEQPTATGKTVTLTFPEGYTVDQIVQKLEKYEVCTAAVLYQTMREVDFSKEFSFIAAMDDKEARFRMLEGYLYPDTYEFYVGESPSSILRKFLNNFNKKWTDEYAAQAEKLGMSVDDIITLASIVQKEAFGAEQSPLVSSVLHNRLDKSGLYPSLQCDSTEEYINEYIKADTKDAAQLSQYTNRYHTYKCAGLPVGAICNPGDDAIKAALYPENTDYYFFAHDVNKKLYLARNDSERRSNNLTILNVNSEAEKNKNNG